MHSEGLKSAKDIAMIYALSSKSLEFHMGPSEALCNSQEPEVTEPSDWLVSASSSKSPLLVRSCLGVGKNAAESLDNLPSVTKHPREKKKSKLC